MVCECAFITERDSTQYFRVCVCEKRQKVGKSVCKWEKERERKRASESEKVCMCVCLCVWERESACVSARVRERERTLLFLFPIFFFSRKDILVCHSMKTRLNKQEKTVFQTFIFYITECSFTSDFVITEFHCIFETLFGQIFILTFFLVDPF